VLARLIPDDLPEWPEDGRKMDAASSAVGVRAGAMRRAFVGINSSLSCDLEWPLESVDRQRELLYVVIRLITRIRAQHAVWTGHASPLTTVNAALRVDRIQISDAGDGEQWQSGTRWAQEIC